MKDVHLALGLDKGGSPSSVKVVLALENQKHPHRLSNTIVVAVYPAEKDSYDEVSEVLKEHLQQIRDLVRDGVFVNGERRAVRLFLSDDYEALCTFHRHKEASETMPCLMCYSTKTSCASHADFDERFGTLRDLELPAATNLRTAEHLCTMADTFTLATLPRATTSTLSQDAHRSIARAPLLSLDPRQVVPIPLHITMGVTTRLLRLAMELIISCRGRAVGLPYAYELSETLRTSVRVSPAPYHGGVFIGHACHAIAEGGDVVCRTLLGLVPERDHVSYQRLWALWRKLVRTLNRAVDVGPARVRDFRSCADLFVRHLKLCVPWASISPKLHILFRHATDFMSRFGSVGIYDEQSIEAWHGF